MASFFELTLDTKGPQDPSVEIAAGAAFVTGQVTTADFSTSDSSTTGYQVKIWGDVDPAANADIQAEEGESDWISYEEAVAIKLSAGDGTKTIFAKIRDDVWNETGELEDSVVLDTTVPVVTISAGPTPTTISEVTGKDESDFSFQANDAFVAYKVKVVPATASLHSAGTQIPETAGSVNMSDSGEFPKETNIDCTIDGTDLKTAGGADGTKIVKVFVQDTAGNWSVA